jgi:hypothetical protein
MAYGTIAHVEVEEKRVSLSKYAVAFGAVALACVGVIALSTTASTRVSAAVNSNRGRAQIGVIDPDVRELGLEVLNFTDAKDTNLRWAIFGFNEAKDVIIPLTAGDATADWEKDFKMFTNALPEEDAAVGVYNFQYWVDDDTTTTEPIMITWAPHCDTNTYVGGARDVDGKCKGMDARAEARAGYYLPGIILALNTDEGRINTEFGTMTGDKIGAHKEGFDPAPAKNGFSGPYRLDSISDTYFEFCNNEMGLPEKDCSLERTFHNCPFESENEEDWTEENPCLKEVCDGGEFTNPDATSEAYEIPQACCDYIEDEFCADPRNYATSGCHEVTLTAIGKLCEVPEEPPRPIQEFQWAEVQRCAPECQDACRVISERGAPADTWKLCEGCRLDLMPDDMAENPGQISQCAPGQPYYETMTCCGNAVTESGDLFCQLDENLSSTMCNMLEYNNCVWIEQRDCPAEVRRQNIADSPTGCCYAEDPEPAPNTFGTSADYSTEGLGDDVPMVLCGGGMYNAEGDSIFVEGETCETVQAGFQALLEAYEEEQAALAAVTVTTAAPVRV